MQNGAFVPFCNLQRTLEDRRGEGVMEQCIECGEAVNLYEDDLTVEFAKDVLDFLYEDPATARRLRQPDHQPGAGATAPGPASRPRSSTAAFHTEGPGAAREQYPAGLLRAARPGSGGRRPARLLA